MQPCKKYYTTQRNISSRVLATERSGTFWGSGGRGRSSGAKRAPQSRSPNPEIASLKHWRGSSRGVGRARRLCFWPAVDTFQEQFTVMGKIRERERMTVPTIRLRTSIPRYLVQRFGIHRDHGGLIHPEVRRKCRSKTGIARPDSVASYLTALSRGKAALRQVSHSPLTH